MKNSLIVNFKGFIINGRLFWMGIRNVFMTVFCLTFCIQKGFHKLFYICWFNHLSIYLWAPTTWSNYWSKALSKQGLKDHIGESKLKFSVAIGIIPPSDSIQLPFSGRGWRTGPVILHSERQNCLYTGVLTEQELQKEMKRNGCPEWMYPIYTSWTVYWSWFALGTLINGT